MPSRRPSFLLLILSGLLIPAVVRADDEIVVRDRRVDPGVPRSAVISVLELASLRARFLDGAHVLDWLPGVDVRDFGGIGQPRYVQLRGASAEQVLVLVDGVRLNPILGGGADLSLADLSDMDRVEVLKGPAAARYGSDGIGGVVRFVRARPRAPVTRVAATAGSFETLRLAFENTTPVSHHTVVQSGFDTTTTGGAFRFYDAQRDRFEVRENNDSVRSRVRLAVQHDGAGGELGVRVRLAQLEAGSPGFVEFPTERARRTASWGSASADYARVTHWGSWRAAVHEKIERQTYENPDAFLGGGRFANESTARGSGAEWIASLHVSDRVSASLLTDARWERLTGGDYGRPSRLAGGAQIGAEVELGRLSLGPALRVDTAERTRVQALPSLGASVEIVDGLTVGANAGRVWRAPSFVELYHPDMEYVAGNPDLAPENGWSVDASLGWARTLGPLQLDAKATWFAQIVEQGILWAPVSAFRYQPVNTGQARSEGLELSGGARLDGFQLDVMYTRLATLRLATGDPLPAKPPHRASLRGRYQWRRLAAFAEVTHTGDAFADFHANLVVPGGTDIGAGLSVGPFSGTTATIEVRNLLNTPLRDARYFPLPGRSVYATLLWEL